MAPCLVKHRDNFTFTFYCIKENLSLKCILAQLVKKFPDYFVSEFHYRVQGSPTLNPNLSQFDRVDTYFLKDCFIIIFRCTAKFSSSSLPDKIL